MGAFANFQVSLAVKGWYLNFGAKSRLGKCNRNFAVNVGTVALENRVRTDIYNYVRVSGHAAVYARVAFAAQDEHLTVVDTRRYINCLLTGTAHLTLAAAGAARLFDNFTAASTLVAGTLCLNLAERRALDNLNLARSVARRTGFGRCSVGGAAAVAVGTAVN